jgi:hypothetical protein
MPKVLTKEIAEQFLADEDSVDLSEFTAIEDEAAEVLGGYKGSLYLHGLVALTDTSACSLGNHKGDLHLNSLVTLTDTSACSLGNHKGNLDLSGVACLSTNSISYLMQHKGEINLESLQELDVDGAKAISAALSHFVLDDDQFSDEVQAILNVHPELRLNSIDLEEWLLAELGFENENEGDDWLSEETTEALEAVADSSYSWDDEDNCWLGSDIGNAPFDEGFILIMNAWRRVINTVRLYDSRLTQLVFFGDVEEIKSDLQPIIESAKSGSED